VEDRSFERLATARLTIRRFGPADAQPFAAYRSDPEVARYQAWESPYLVHEAEKFISASAGLVPGKPGTWFQFAVALTTSGTLIGDVALRTRRGDPRQAELGFTFAATHQRQGYATEAVAAVVEYAFARLAMHRLLSMTDARNLPAQRLLERLAFRREGELRENTWFKGAWATEILYAKLECEQTRRLTRRCS
jgi:RimJ/RimL family protein N-acetyltransferase